MSSQTVRAKGNKALSRAREAKQDEFYTQLSDIENELKHYRAQLKNKVVLCNCDDPYESNFFKYFANNFNKLGLRKLIATSYDGSTVAGGLFPLTDMKGLSPKGKGPIAIEINEVLDHNADGAIDLADVKWLLSNDVNCSRTLKSDAQYGAGDFRSAECVALVEQADVVVTNPPFSLFREYLEQLVEKNKSFLIIGNMNALHYQDVFKLIRDGKVWQGNYSGDMAFRVPAHYEPRETRYWVDDTGQKWRSLGTGCWFTNLDHSRRHEEIPLFKRYDPDTYPTYDNFDAIEVRKTSDIPVDYYGLMGVPDTIFNIFNPEQFELVGIPFGNMGKELGVQRNYRGRTDISLTGADGKSRCPYSRIIIRRKVAA